MADAARSTQDGLSRRSFLNRSAATGLGVALAGSLDSIFGATAASGADTATGGFGPLVADPRGKLSLPPGFTYTVIAQEGVSVLDSGEKTPGRMDGTASFPRPRGDGVVLVNNHEISGLPEENVPVPHLSGLVYDPGAYGGTTNIEVDAEGKRVREYVSLAGTDNNCAGGATPWNTWLSCEETEDVPDASDPENTLTKRHGYVFEVDPYVQVANRNPKPIKALGRFAHEAAVVDPNEGVLYLSEDASEPNGLLYRWTPPSAALPLGRGSLRRLGDQDGVLEAMRAFTGAGRFVPDLSLATRPGTTFDLEWVTVEERDAVTTSTRKQFDYDDVSGTPGGRITRSRKFEGQWWGDGGAYVVASFARFEDGSARQHDGQVWFLDPLRQTLELKLIFAYTPRDQDSDPDGPDNITVSPFGGVILAEDGEGKQHLVGASSSGKTFFFARNEIEGDSEFTGPNFAPDRRTLYANVQSPGHVFAIRGPFRGA